MKFLKIFLLAFLLNNIVQAQDLAADKDTVFAFFNYKLKNDVGIEDAFNAGYERDLEWHKSQNDKWTWLGWYVTNGPRRGWFIDATPNHTWNDFDNWNVNASENGRLNKIHWLPYVESSDGSYEIALTNHSKYVKDWFKSPYLQVYHISIDIQKEILFNEFLFGFTAFLKTKIPYSNFLWMKNASGGSTSGYTLFVSVNKLQELGNIRLIFDAKEMPHDVWLKYSQTVIKNESELWRYQPKLSLYPLSDR